MRYLLDTHVIIWGVNNSDKLCEAVKKILENKDSQIFISIVSLWEFVIKHAKGQLPFEGGFSRLYEIIKQAGFTILPITQGSLAALAELPFIENHKDPFDRLLIATAKAEEMTILTADKNIHKYDIPHIW